MSYTITLTDGSTFATIPDGTINQSSSVSLPGKNYAGYGAYLDENFIQILENFSSPATSGGLPTSTKLGAPLQGQLWWDSTNKVLKVYNGTAWKTSGSTTSSATASLPTLMWVIYGGTVVQVNSRPGTEPHGWLLAPAAWAAQG
jgi:hypothetical protein